VVLSRTSGRGPCLAGCPSILHAETYFLFLNTSGPQACRGAGHGVDPGGQARGRSYVRGWAGKG
jgi:hypothetical protein